MKTITICDKQFDIDCNALTYVKYKSFFKTGIIQDMQTVKEYLIKQSVISNQLKDTKLNDAERMEKISEYMKDDVDIFVIKVTQIAWILIYTANNRIEDYEDWLKSIKSFKIDDDWIAEVTEFAVNCFC